MELATLSQRTRSRNAIPLIAALWAAIVGVYLLIASTSGSSSGVLTSIPPTTLEVVKDKLIEYASTVAVIDFDSAFGLFLPTLLALCSLAFRKYRRVALLITGGLNLAIYFVWPFSIGLLYFPTAVLLLFAALRTDADLAPAV